MKTFNYFKIDENTTREELNSQYRKLVKMYHPDLNRDRDTTEDMKQINAEYEYICENLDTIYRFSTREGKRYTNKNSNFAFREYMKIINDIVRYNNIKIELIGSWLWVSGDTLPIKETLKNYGFGWSHNKKSWYKHFEPFTKKTSTRYTMNELRNMFGSVEYEKDTESNENQPENKRIENC